MTAENQSQRTTLRQLQNHSLIVGLHVMKRGILAALELPVKIALMTMVGSIVKQNAIRR